MAKVFKRIALLELGPDALLGLRLQSSIMTPETDMVIFWHMLATAIAIIHTILNSLSGKLR